MTNAGAITFRSLMTEDLPPMHAWINTPHVAEWWDPMPTLDDVACKYVGRIAGQEPTRSFVIECDERPIGYIQTYRIADYPEYAKQLDVRENAAGVDLFIGDATRVGRGTGTRVLSKFLRTVVFADETVDECILGPEERNQRAIRCYTKVGFRYWKTVQIPGERAPEYLMRIARSDLNLH